MLLHGPFTLIVYKPGYSMLDQFGDLRLVSRAHALHQLSDLQNLEPVVCQRHGSGGWIA